MGGSAREIVLDIVSEFGTTPQGKVPLSGDDSWCRLDEPGFPVVVGETSSVRFWRSFLHRELQKCSLTHLTLQSVTFNNSFYTHVSLFISMIECTEIFDS